MSYLQLEHTCPLAHDPLPPSPGPPLTCPWQNFCDNSKHFTQNPNFLHQGRDLLKNGGLKRSLKVRTPRYNKHAVSCIYALKSIRTLFVDGSIKGIFNYAVMDKVRITRSLII